MKDFVVAFVTLCVAVDALAILPLFVTLTEDLSRRDDYYHADKLRWLQHVSMGPIRVEGAPETPGQPSGAGAAWAAA